MVWIWWNRRRPSCWIEFLFLPQQQKGRRLGNRPLSGREEVVASHTHAHTDTHTHTHTRTHARRVAGWQWWGIKGGGLRPINILVLNSLSLSLSRSLARSLFLFSLLLSFVPQSRGHTSTDSVARPVGPRHSPPTQTAWGWWGGGGVA